MTDIWSFITEPEVFLGVLTFLGVVLAALITAGSIRRFKEQKSFDLFTQKRLRSHNRILHSYQKLMLLSSPNYIRAAVAKSYHGYLADYETAHVKLYGELSTAEKQEYYLLQEYDKLRRCAKRYARFPTKRMAQALNEQRTCVKCFTDIYLWALWNYIQRLHRKRNEDSYHRFFDKEFEKYYGQSKKLNVNQTAFFINHPITELVDQQRSPICRILCRDELKKHN